jgi:hypothetical protein
MERLTLEEEITHIMKVAVQLELDNEKIRSENYKLLQELKTYEDLEEQGLLVRLPCKLNGTLYSVNYSNKTIAENTIIKISINDHVKRFYCIDDNLRERIFFSRRIGENVFLTREEAKKKLEELKK